MGAQAVALAKAVNYRSAGTVEFIVDAERNFYFLEMNTRLQVEHPVTELVTGIDLVEEMIRIAAGEKLRLGQNDVRPKGWAVEARIYAEDPYRDFLPSVGRLTRYRPPAEGKAGDAAIRVDSGVVEGSEISLYYDPMLAKLCACASDRDAAIDAMADALDAFTLDGIRHNIPFLAALMAHPRWREGRLSTGFIAEAFPGGFRGVTPDRRERDILTAIAVSAELAERRRLAPLMRLPAAAHGGDAEHVLLLGREHVPVRLSESAGPAPLAATLSIDGGGAIEVWSNWRPGERVWRGSVGGEPVLAQIERRGHALHLARRGVSLPARLMTKRAAALAALMPEESAADTSKLLLCPMPGLVVSIPVAEGQQVEAGETLAIVEAMKMENVLRAERSATVGRILAKPGDSLAVDAVIMEFA
jgi:propionyl-CoA carboxylase alpha chain